MKLTQQILDDEFDGMSNGLELKKMIRVLCKKDDDNTWVWSLKDRENTIEYSGMVFLFCCNKIKELDLIKTPLPKMAIFIRHPKIIKLFKYLKIPLTMDPLKMILSILQQWDKIEIC